MTSAVQPPVTNNYLLGGTYLPLTKATYTGILREGNTDISC